MKFKEVRIHFVGDIFGLLSSKNFATMTTNRSRERYKGTCRGGSRGRVQGVRTPPPEMTCGFLIKLLFCKKNCGLLVLK